MISGTNTGVALIHFNIVIYMLNMLNQIYLFTFVSSVSEMLVPFSLHVHGVVFMRFHRVIICD